MTKFEKGMEDGIDFVCVAVGMSEESIAEVQRLVKSWYGIEPQLNALYQIPFINTPDGVKFVADGDYVENKRRDVTNND